MSNSKYDHIFSEREKDKMREEYKNGVSIRDIQKKYNINCRDWVQYRLLNGLTRNVSEALVEAHKRYPDSFKHSNETKLKMRKSRLKFMREHPEKTAWRKRNEPSYPEKCFIKFLEESEYDKKYLIEREYPVFPYYIDFAFVDSKVAVEIDGSQHVLDEERVKRDKDKDNVLVSNGWRVLRFTENIVKTDWILLKEKLDEAINDTTTMSVTKVGIFMAKKPRKKVERGTDGLSEKMRENALKQRKVKNRPTLEELEKLMETLPLTKIGKMYGVSDNAVRKWIKQYKKTI